MLTNMWPSTGYKTALTVGTVLCALILTACGGTPGQVHAGSGTSLPGTWVNRNSAQGTAAMVTWTIVHSSVSGNLDIAALSSSSTSVNSRSLSFAGTISGESLTLTFKGTTTLSGTVTPTKLTLDLPQTNGQISVITLVPNSTAAYNAEVAALQVSANTAAQYAQQQQTKAAQAAAEEAAAHAERKAIRDDVANVIGDLSALQDDESQLASSVASVKNALGSEGNALAKTAQELAKVQALIKQYGTGSGNGVCGYANANVADYADANVAGYANANVGGEASANVIPNISSIQSDTQSLQSDFQSLQAAEAAMPSYLPANTPTASMVQQAVAAGNTDISNAISTTNGYIGQANNEVVTAYGYVAVAYKAGNCGTPPNPPSPVSTISASAGSG